MPVPEDLARARCVLLTTFRRDGTPVPTPVWHVVHGDEIWTTTSGDAGKVKRIRASGRVTIAPCTQRGTPTGPQREGRARVLGADESREALELKKRRYRLHLLIELFERLRRTPAQVGVAIRLT